MSVLGSSRFLFIIIIFVSHCEAIAEVETVGFTVERAYSLSTLRNTLEVALKGQSSVSHNASEVLRRGLIGLSHFLQREIYFFFDVLFDAVSSVETSFLSGCIPLLD